MSKKTRKLHRDDDDGTSEALPDGWDQFTSSDGHVYYYNADTKESRWDLPSKDKEEVLVPFKLSRRDSKDNNNKVFDQAEPLIRSRKVKKEKHKTNKTTEEHDTVAAGKPSNVMFQKLQASLGGKLEKIHTGPPPMMNIRREGLLEYTEGATGQEVKTPLTSVEEQYETETAGMSAAERFRFLRKKRQENMMAKRESSMGDDFMAEVAKNMKKKGVVVLRKEEREGNEKMVSWEEQEKEEEERKRRQIQEEIKIKKEKRNEQITKEREERLEQERAKQLELEQPEHDEQEKKRKKQDKKEKKKKKKKDDEIDERNVGLVSDCHEMSGTGQHEQNQLSVVENVVEQHEEDLDVSSPERVKYKRHNRSQNSKYDISMDRQAIKHMESVEDDHPPTDDRLSPRFEVKFNAVQDDKQRMREERRARKQREKDMLVASKLSSVTSELPRPKSTSSLNEVRKEFQNPVN
ncbi:unnamed protein product [Peronospora destructor]|uniref:WW domain-containing protein n=1 Tax=Peronospora destructor TaxID=86335 RepID=A0AAV0TA41_9STRA|nr:unnamed protein product [Peronospora destructor]